MFMHMLCLKNVDQLEVKISLTHFELNVGIRCMGRNSFHRSRGILAIAIVTGKVDLVQK